MAERTIELTDEQIYRLKTKIIMKESKNLKDKLYTDQKMIQSIKTLIEEEIQCCLNQ